jgi:FAD/FMN-containing dehydrogenase
VSTDLGSLAAAADDFGHIVHHRPRAVARPTDAAEVVAILREADGLGVRARGKGHTAAGQAQVADGIVVEMDGLATIHDIADDRIVVDAGATWRSVVTATAAHGRTPPVLTDYLDVTVGGTLSAGGVGGGSHRHGLQTDNVLALDVATQDGQTTCSAETSPDLFRAALAGYGRAGIITRATLRLVPAPATVRRYVLSYPSADARARDQRLLVRDGRFEHVQGQMIAGPDGWLHLLEAGAFDSQDDAALLAGLAFDPEGGEITDLTHLEFADRLASGVAFLRETGDWYCPHPWWNAFLPDSTVDDFMNRLGTRLTPAGLGASGLVLTYPINTAPVRTALFELPDEPVVFLVSLLRTAPRDDPARLADMLVDNDYWYEQALAAGGTVYPIGTVPTSAARPAP